MIFSSFFRSVLEYDSEMFTKISFLFEWNDFYFIIIGKFVKTLSMYMDYNCLIQEKFNKFTGFKFS